MCDRNLRVPGQQKKQTQPHRGISQSKCSRREGKMIEKYLWSSSFFDKDTESRSAILLQMNSFTGIVKDFAKNLSYLPLFC